MNIPEKHELPYIAYPTASELIENITHLIASEQEVLKSPESPTSTEVMLQKAIILNANQIWRISSAIFDPETKEAREELRPQEIRKVAKAVESLIETLNGLGVRMIDRLGETFDHGMPDQVVTEEPREGISREQIIRTIRPTIVWNETMVQRGEVDIAVPINKK